MTLNTPQSEQTGPRVLGMRGTDFWGRRGAVIRPSFPLCHDDSTVMFVNAGITPFKPDMLNGAVLPVTAVVQRCLRTRWRSRGLLQFHMLTVVGMADQLEDVTNGTFAMLEELGYSRDALSVVADPRDQDLVGVVEPCVGLYQLRLQKGNTDAYWTRWSFGSALPLLGCGVTIVAHGDCSLGNIIVVRNLDSGKAYLDVGFGLERLAEGLSHRDTEIDDWAAALEAFSMPAEDRRQVLYYLDPILTLIEEGVQPSAKRHGYVLRKLLRTVFGLLPPETEHALNLVSAVLQEKAVAGERLVHVLMVISREARNHAEGLKRRREKAQRYVSRNRARPEEEVREYLRGTLGIPAREIDELLTR